MKSKSNETKKNVLYIMILTFIGRILGFVRDVMIGSKFGATHITDAYFVAASIPTIIYSNILTAITTTYIPFYTKARVEGGEEGSRAFTNNVLNIVSVISIVICLLGMIFTRPIVSVIGAGFDNGTLELAIRLTRIIFPVIIFVGIANIFSGYLQANNEFKIPAIACIPQNGIIIVAIIFSGVFGIKGLIYATLISTIVQAFIQVPWMREKGFKYRLGINLKDSNIKGMGIAVIPVLAGVGIDQINSTIERILASGLVEGSISALNFASKLTSFVYGVISVSVSTVIYTKLAEYKEREDTKQFNTTLISAINTITLIVVPITAVTAVLSVPIISVLFERGAFDKKATMLTASALLFYSFGMVFCGYRTILNRTFFALHDTKTPMINASIGLGINIIINLLLIRYMQHAGLALGNSITYFVITVLLFISLKKKIGKIDIMKVLTILIKCIFASLNMGLLIYFSYNCMIGLVGSGIFGMFISLVVTVIPGMVIYIGILYTLEVEELQSITKPIENKIKRLVSHR